MTLPRIDIDFAPRRGRVRAAGAVLLVLGMCALAWVALTHQRLTAQMEGLEVRLDTLGAVASPPPVSGAAARLLAEAQSVTAALRAPWSTLLSELEQAGVALDGSVALIDIEPDLARHKVRLIVEARSFPDVFAYMQQLQSTTALRDPLLDSHEVQTSASERPVRAQITAEWRAGA